MTSGVTFSPRWLLQSLFLVFLFQKGNLNNALQEATIGKELYANFTTGTVVMLGPFKSDGPIKEGMMLVNSAAQVFTIPKGSLRPTSFSVGAIRGPFTLTGLFPALKKSTECSQLWSKHVNAISFYASGKVYFLYGTAPVDGADTSSTCVLDTRTQEIIYRPLFLKYHTKGAWVSAQVDNTMYTFSSAGGTMAVLETEIDASGVLQQRGTRVLCFTDASKKAVHFRPAGSTCLVPVAWPVKVGTVSGGRVYLFTEKLVITFNWNIYGGANTMARLGATSDAASAPVTETPLSAYIQTESSGKPVKPSLAPAINKPHGPVAPNPKKNKKEKATSTTESKLPLILGLAIPLSLILLALLFICIFCRTVFCCFRKEPGSNPKETTGHRSKQGQAPRSSVCGSTAPELEDKEMKKKETAASLAKEKKGAPGVSKASSQKNVNAGESKNAFNKKSTLAKVGAIKSITGSKTKAASSFKALSATRSKFAVGPKSRVPSKSAGHLASSLVTQSNASAATGSAVRPSSSILSKKDSKASSLMAPSNVLGATNSTALSTVASSVAPGAIGDKSIISKVTLRKAANLQ